MNLNRISLAFAITLIIGTSVLARVPWRIGYQGTLHDKDGNPIKTPQTITFSIWDQYTNGNKLWEEKIENQKIDNGRFSVMLGGHTELSPSIFNQHVLFLEIVINGEKLTPRQSIGSVPFAYMAENSGSGTGGLTLPFSGAYDGNKTAFLVTHTGIGHAINGNATKTGKFLNRGGYFTAAGDSGEGIRSKSSGIFGIGVNGFGSGKYSNGVMGVSSGENGIGISGYATNTGNFKNFGGLFIAKGDSGRAVQGTTFGDYSHTINGTANGKFAYGVVGFASNTGDVRNFGGSFTAKGRQGWGVYGVADYQGVGTTYGGVFRSYSSDGIGAAAFSYGANGRGLDGQSLGATGKGVVGLASSEIDAVNYGGFFEAKGKQGIGVWAKGGQNGYAGQFRGNVVITSWATGEKVVEFGEGLDYAEGFNVSDKTTISAGCVLSIDSENPGKLVLCNQPYDTKVAGIVAGANNLGSGVRLGGEKFDFNIALAGRVYCNVDASEDTIEPGDLLTTSVLPGYATKVRDYSRAQGSVIGKAMERLEKGQKGQILVLVTLQ